MADETDRIIGENLREFRLQAGLSQAGLSAQLDISFQQLQKYEKGMNRLSAARLWQLSCLLGIDCSRFFQGAAAPDQINTKDESLTFLFAALRRANPDLREAIATILRVR